MPGLNKVLQIKGKKRPNWKTGKKTNKQTKSGQFTKEKIKEGDNFFAYQIGKQEKG